VAPQSAARHCAILDAGEKDTVASGERTELVAMKWNIKTKLVIMGVSAIAAMAVLVWLFFSTSDQVGKAETIVEKEIVHLDALVSLRMAGKELVLAAMDSIVDQLEGTILTERRENMDKALALFVKENERLLEAAKEAGEMGKVADGSALADDILENLAILEQASIVDLERALRNRDEDELERLDSVIDESGEALDESLALLQNASASELQDAMTGLTNEVDSSTNLALTVFIFGLFIMSGVMGYLGFSITTPISRLTRVMGELAGGKLDIEIVDMGRGDEVGEMAEAVQVFKDNAIEKTRLEEEQAAAAQRAEEEKRQTMNEMADRFERSVKEVVDGVSSAATEMQATSQQMSATAEETSRQSANVATASDQATANVQTVAATAEELSASISEIGRQVMQSAKIAQNAVEEAEATNETVKGLADAAAKIGEVVDLINDIAGQTNLLALNATIEAARAGEAGKGFAVVAQEVKNLANQTAKATEEISSQIGAVQEETQDAVGAIEKIRGIIGEVNDIATTISSAVEEQGVSTQEIARNVQQAAQGTQDVNQNIESVSKAAGETGSAANQVLTASQEMAQQAEGLRGEVDRFLNEVRAA
jgi:methyl-accepting chemotaxis protein